MVVDLAADPPTLSTKIADPPIYAPAGARYRNGLIYFAAGGGNESMNGTPYRPGIYSLDPRTGKSQNVVNNYYGYYFNTVCLDLTSGRCKLIHRASAMISILTLKAGSGSLIYVSLLFCAAIYHRRFWHIGLN